MPLTQENGSQTLDFLADKLNVSQTVLLKSASVSQNFNSHVVITPFMFTAKILIYYFVALKN